VLVKLDKKLFPDNLDLPPPPPHPADIEMISSKAAACWKMVFYFFFFGSSPSCRQAFQLFAFLFIPAVSPSQVYPSRSVRSVNP
jgi:hypothetical protein